ncbi:hypothetical protein DAEQUDRAFT_756019 [Daedalea quercina L-15889]|uniref:Protein kinase domain-containing protein n=1 Tax=Daedalea quercina L-15889 TaxID=1314783 RepID=A0A165RLY8_9APHY|nr:hypothetical protein DAEQUDRAFT_756019 [Daedalea quercina L-15889]
MFASTPATEYVSFRPSRHDQSASPSCRLSFNTPPRFATESLVRDSPMFTPSPLRRHAPPSAEPMDMDDIFQSPAARPSSYTHRSPTRLSLSHRHTDDMDDDFDNSLLVPSSSYSVSRNMAPPTSPFPLLTPIRTPVKSSPRFPGTPDRAALSVKHVNMLSSASPGVSAGSKRKPTPNPCVTPMRPRARTPLQVASAKEQSEGDPSAVEFDRLAPLPAPRFNLRTPQSNAEAELHLKRQAETMTMLRLSDVQRSDDESGYDSGPDVREAEDNGQALFDLSRTPFNSTKGKGKTKSPALEVFIRTGQMNNEEVAEAISPGGHVTKRRARSRPVSAELLESAQGAARAGFEYQVPVVPDISGTRSASSVNFPRRRRASTSSNSESEFGSPVPRLRLTPGALPRIRTQSQAHTKAPLSRITSTGSATQFFGPSIPEFRSGKKKSKGGSIASPRRGMNLAAMKETYPETERSPASNRHSYCGSTGVPSAWLWHERAASSPVSSPSCRKRDDSSEDEEDAFFNGPADTSFNFSIASGTPSPKKRQKREAPPSPLQKKFRPRDSGIALYSSDDDCGGYHLHGGDPFLPAMPRASTSVSTVNSSEGDDQALVTPGFGPSVSSGWPGTEVNIVRSGDDSDDMEAFILRTLTAGATKSAPGHDSPKRVPGTPQKRLKTSYLGQRPWQSAVTSKIGFPEFDEDGPKGKGKGKGKPRKSLPAAFPILGKENRGKNRLGHHSARVSVDMDADEDEDLSPSATRQNKYDGLGLGRPSGVLPGFTRPSGDKGRPTWLMRRSSSGNFSSGSETTGSASATPTRLGAREWTIAPPRLPPAPTTPSSTTSATPNSPSTARHLRTGASALPQPTPVRAPLFTRPQTHAHPSRLPHGHTSPLRPNARGRLSLASGEEQPGRFDRDFIEVDEVGKGEFGRVMKVRYKDGAIAGRGKEAELYAVKKSKRFEGAKHRLRLREEVDILSGLAARGGHPNVLAYVDSWEEDETLFIQTELCALGNFAHFLLAYGRAYPKLDEGRVWRILAELSAGLRFIHDAGMIHLDIKPENVFITSLGRFKIGDFGMASLWPRPPPPQDTIVSNAFEREGDKLYLAPEVLQGRYGKAADVFSLGMTILETATNIVVPGQGESWHRLRQEDFSQADNGLESLSEELRSLICSMMRTDPAVRVGIGLVASHPVVSRARTAMEEVRAAEGDVFAASPLGGGGKRFLDDILLRPRWTGDAAMDVGY